MPLEPSPTPDSDTTEPTTGYSQVGAAEVLVMQTGDADPEAVGINDLGHVMRLLLACPSASPVQMGTATEPTRVCSQVRAAGAEAPALSMVMPIANHRLWVPGGGTTTCAAAVIDWDVERGDAHVVQAGPVEVWVRTESGWWSLFDRQYQRPESAEHERDGWWSAPVATFDRSVSRTASAFGVEAVVLTSPPPTPAEMRDPNSWWSALTSGSRVGATMVYAQRS